MHYDAAANTRHLLLLSQKTVVAPAMAYCSLGAFGPAPLIHAVVANAQLHIGCAVLLHVSLGARAGNQTLQRANVTLNPTSLPYRRHGPNVLAAHLSNLRLIPQHTAGDATIVLLPGQGVFTRDCRPHLARHVMSFPSAVAYQPRASADYGWFKQLFDHLERRGGDGALAAAPLAVMPHEGSFFPWAVLRHVLPLTESVALLRACPYFICTLEELVIPSLILQHVPAVYHVAHAPGEVGFGDPLVERVFNWSMSAARFLAYPTRRCGRKLVHDDGERVALEALRAMSPL